MNTTRRIPYACTALVAVCLVAAFSPASAKDYSAQLKQVAKSVNAKLPTMVDKATRLDHIEAGPGNNLAYDFTLVSYEAGSAKAKKIAANVRTSVINRACQKPATLNMLKMGVTMHYVYRGKDGGQIAEFAIKAGDCGSA